MPNIIKMEDAAHPGAMKADIIAGYIGGSKATHIWTDAEWARFAGTKKLPIYVSSEALGGNGNGVNDGFDCMRKLYSLGVPKQPVALDMETRVDAAYVTGFNRVLSWAGYLVWVYGSKDFVFRNPACHGYWVADFTGFPHMVDHADVRATQYETSTGVDLSEVKLWQYIHRIRWQ